jgi:inward rectifier potassium channel
MDKVTEDSNKDLGLGSRVTERSHQRFLNRDGSFNVEKIGLPFWRSQNLYHWLLTISWTKFFFLVSFFYFVTNVLFATGYVLCGPDALHGITTQTTAELFIESFFFSVQTLATIGYGAVSPKGLPANILVSIEALFGMLGFALITGILFARFSKPQAKILFSDNAVIAPFRDATAFMFRVANERSNQMIEVQATVSLSLFEGEGEKRTRRFHLLSLEREKVTFMPLHWVIVHPIDASSPLFGISEEKFRNSEAEILILLTGVDETFSQTIHARTSYKQNEVIWNAKFVDMFIQGDNGKMGVDMRKIHEIVKL